ncbi:MAG: aspartyl/glutamyl-tRNA amidotransferase subunit C [Ruminococcaceae bacterium]|nr:aspartyl/glutamyl-tRNA amidotransferase subunit C [Oscillospiraceae bacterium]
MITEKDIKDTLKLSCLEISKEDMPRLKSDMEYILDFAQIVCEYDFDEDSQSEDEASVCRLREDKTEPSYPSQEMLSNAPLHKDGYIVLRKSE